MRSHSLLAEKRTPKARYSTTPIPFPGRAFLAPVCPPPRTTPGQPEGPGIHIIVGLRPSYKRWAAAGYLAVLLSVNAYIGRDLFLVEYTGRTNSIQGLWITMARLAEEHWFQPAWWAVHDGGMPFEHTYMPLVPGSTAFVAKLAQWSPPRAFNAVTGVVYCLGPLTLFLLAWWATRAPGYSFSAALVYSLTSPARAVLAETGFNPDLLWTNHRLYTMAVWDDTPHEAALCFLPLVILFLWLSLERRRPIYYLGAGVSMVLTVSASVFGAVAIALSVVCLLFVLPVQRLRSNILITGAIGCLSYLVISPFLPPSMIATIRANQQAYPEDQWSWGSLAAVLIVAVGWSILWFILRRWTQDRALRFFVLFAYIASMIPLLEVFAGLHFLPQARRYQPEMAMGLALAFVFLARPIVESLPRSAKLITCIVLLSAAAWLVVNHRRDARLTVYPVDITRHIEYRVAKWVDLNMPGLRVMVPGSIAQWFNVFSDTPQLSGASYSTTPNPNQQAAMNNVLTSRGPDEAAISVLWLKAFGVHAVTVCGPRSSEFWKPYSDPRKFEGLLPVAWREDDVTIYRVPQRSTSLARVIPEAAVPDPGSGPSLPLHELRKYVSALDDPGMPEASMHWKGSRRIHIETTVHEGQVVSLQTAYHRGWHAQANGLPAKVSRDGLGFLVVRPECDGHCAIEMTYDGGWEYRLARLLSLLTLLGVLSYSALRLARQPSFRLFWRAE